MRRWLLRLLALLLVLAAVGVYLGSRGGYDRVTRAEVSETPWARPCMRADRVISWGICARVRGRVVWVQRRDPDGDGDRHVVLVAALHVRVTKISKRHPEIATPGIGDTITAVGPVVRGASERDEVAIERLSR